MRSDVCVQAGASIMPNGSARDLFFSHTDSVGTLGFGMATIPYELRFFHMPVQNPQNSLGDNLRLSSPLEQGYLSRPAIQSR